MTRRNYRKKNSASATPAPPTTSTFVSSSDESDVDDGASHKKLCPERLVGATASNRERNIDELYAEIEYQRSVISVLTNRLNFVLSMFGIDEIPSSVKQIKALKTRGDTEQVVSNPKAKGNGNLSVRLTDKSVSATASFQGAVLSTMYKEKQLQESRIKNFVVKGLFVNSHDDKRCIEELCQNELKVSPEIVSCRRLSKVITGKVKPLFVTVHSAQEARSLISLACNLRRSNNAFV